MVQPLVVITGHCFCSTEPLNGNGIPLASPQHRAWCLIAQFNTSTSKYINKIRQALPIFYMASERWIHVFFWLWLMLLFIIFIAVVLGGSNIISYLDVVKNHKRKMISVWGRWHPWPVRTQSSFLLGELSSKKTLTFKREFRKLIMLYSRYLLGLCYADWVRGHYVLTFLARTTWFSAHHATESWHLLY